MSRLRQLFATPVWSDRAGAAGMRAVLTGIGVFTFLFGTYGLQYLGPTRMEAVLALLLLAVFAMMCATLGQVIVLVELLDGRAGRRVEVVPVRE